VRVDFNVPVGDDGIVDNKEDWRIKASLPTIEYLLKKEAKIILISHLGRPKGNQESRIRNQEYSLSPVAGRLKELLNYKIKFIDDCIGNEVEKSVNTIKAGEIIVLENLRFYKEEKENNEEFAKKLAEFADIYVNNAFSVSHRKHASVCAITKFLPSYAGFLLEKEIRTLSNAMHNPKRPATIIIGGAKVRTKLPVIEYLASKFDHILIGGVVANVILKAKGINTGKSLLDEIDIKKVKKIDIYDKKLSIPFDVVICNDNNKVSISTVEKVDNNRILDIGTESRNLYAKIISDSKTIIWNGPMGLFEKEDFSFGTKEIAKAVVKSKGYTIIGGGETIAATDKFENIKKIDHVCTGGGAMLEFLAGKKLPGLEVLE